MNLPPRVLVTGGAGYIGSHCCKALASAGVAPVVYDNLSRGHAEAVLWGPLVVGDIRNQALFQDTLRREKIDAVIHFAALAYVGESVEQPLWYYDNNVAGMSCVLNGMKEEGIRAVVFSSSCATYGEPERMPITENTPQVPINPYGRTKLICEWMLEDASKSDDLQYAALRYFNAAGADPEGQLGEHHDPETHLVPLALQAAMGSGPQLKVFGSDYETADGTCVRDYIHVDDLARAHVLALEAVCNGKENLKLNLGTGKGTSIREILDSVSRVTGREVPATYVERRPGDPPELVADVSQARAKLGFQAKWDEIDDIVRHAAPWFGKGGKTESLA